MNLLVKFLIDYLNHQITNLIAGKKDYYAWKTINYSLRKVTIKNKKLANELEKACTKDGILTYSEFLAIDQFGEHGYHANHSLYGRTDSHKRWATSLAHFCQENGFSSIVEFGPGDGSLGIEIIKKTQKKSYEMQWNGIEINSTLRKEISNRFRKEKLKKQLGLLTSSLDKLSLPKKCLVIFSYSLDSIPPFIFVNSSNRRSYPNKIIGMTIKDLVLKEAILSKEDLDVKEISFNEGIFKDKLGVSYDLRSWNLYPGQRAYLPLNSLSTLAAIVKKAQKDTAFLIIDEFRGQPLPWETGHLLLPKSLFRFRRDVVDLDKAYQEAGDNLYYYSIYFYTFLSFCHSLGFNSVQHDIEQRLARVLEGKSWSPTRNSYTTYAFIASKKERLTPSVMQLQFPQKKII